MYKIFALFFQWQKKDVSCGENARWKNKAVPERSCKCNSVLCYQNLSETTLFEISYMHDCTVPHSEET